MPRMLTIKEAAQETGLSYNCLRQWCLSGTITHVKAGSKFLINMDKLKDFLNGEIKDAAGVDQTS